MVDWRWSAFRNSSVGNHPINQPVSINIYFLKPIKCFGVQYLESKFNQMKNKLLSIFLGGSMSLISFSGCESGPQAQQGVAWGAATGAVLGAIVGHQSGERGAGAAIGAAGGALIGHAVGDDNDRKVAQQRRNQTDLEIARARQTKAEADAKKERLIVTGMKAEDAEVLAAKQKAEAAEAELARLLKEREDAIAKAKALESYEQRQKEAQEQIRNLKGS